MIPTHKIAAWAKCNQCGATLKPGCIACEYCGTQFSSRPPALPPSVAARSRMLTPSIIAMCVSVAAFLILHGARSTPDQDQVAAVYVTPPPPAEPPIPVDPPPVHLVPVPATQVVELPRPQFIRMRTQMLGATVGGGPFEKLGIGNEPVIGFRVTTARWGNKSIVRTLQPVFASDNSVVTPSMIVARPGYAVGGVIVDGDDHVTAMRIIFMKIEAHGLSLKNAYSSDWIGDPTGEPTHLLGGRGQFVIGIYGRNGMNVDALGLYLLAEAVEAPAVTPQRVSQADMGR